MYFVNRSKIEKTLVYMDEILDTFNNESFEAKVERFGLERMVHMFIEGMIDVGNMMIDGFIMRDPGSYADIIDILVDERVIPEEDKGNFLAVIELRETIVRDYMDIDHEELRTTIKENNNELSSFSRYVKSYLDNELGVAHAFSNEAKR